MLADDSSPSEIIDKIAMTQAALQFRAMASDSKVKVRKNCCTTNSSVGSPLKKSSMQPQGYCGDAARRPLQSPA